MFGSNQSLPDTLSLQLLTCLYLPQAATSRPLLPQLPFSPMVTHPTDCHVMTKFVNLICFSLFSKETHYSILFSFFPHSFNCFLHVMPAPICPQKLPLTPALTPLLRIHPGNGLL